MAATNAVLPPRTGWGFEPSTTSTPQSGLNQQNPSKAFFNPFSQPGDSPSRRSLKRRNEDSNMHEQESIIPQEQQQHCQTNGSPSSHRRLSKEDGAKDSPSRHSNGKRPRVHYGFGEGSSIPSRSPRQTLPTRRIIESLSRKGMEDLIVKLCEKHGPEMTNEVSMLAPKVTVTVALDNLKSYYETVCSAFPYRVNQQSDYAFYRVKPHLDDFYAALVDYTVYFLPPQESQSSNSLAYLDGATRLLTELPEWDNPVHNHSKHSMLDEFSSAWVVALKEASKSSNGLGLMFQHGWERKLEAYNEAANNRLAGALAYLRQELEWTDDVAPTSSSPHAVRVNNEGY